uniref:Shavenoid isoform B-like N-terminal domain-containing protein n=1 Tax=Trichuris muris TaxID=70415 RepID=A0A5S6QV83_TRIMR
MSAVRTHLPPRAAPARRQRFNGERSRGRQLRGRPPVGATPRCPMAAATTTTLRALGWALLLLLGAQRPTGAVMVHNITRVFNSGDIFNNPDVNCRPMHCSVYGANSARNSGCNCQCPLGRPAFLQHVKKCADSISDCRMLYFGTYGQTSGRMKLPTVFLPLTGQIVSPSLPPDWKAAGVKLDDDGNVPCALSSIGYLTHSGWIPLDNANLFTLLNSNHYTHIQWLGNKQDQQTLTGKIVEISLQCQDADSPDLCAVFRVIGRDVEISEPAASSQNKENSERTNQLGLVVGIVCGVILALSLVVITVFWTICWKQQKDRLAKKIQFHVLLQQRLQEQNPGVFRHFPRPYNGIHDGMGQAEMYQNYTAPDYGMYTPGSHCWSQRKMNGLFAKQKLFGNKSGHQPPMPPPYLNNRKRLYFSPEFFEPEKMANPPPHAQAFLVEVRSMIDMARNRIRGRRYTPSLVVIPEEERSTVSSAEIDFDQPGVGIRMDTGRDEMENSLALSQSDRHTGESSMEYSQTQHADGQDQQVPEKVAHWLSRHGEGRDAPLYIDRNIPDHQMQSVCGHGQHSNMYNYFAARYPQQSTLPLENHADKPMINASWSKRKSSEGSRYDQQTDNGNGPFARRSSCPTIRTANEVWPAIETEKVIGAQPRLQYAPQDEDNYYQPTARQLPITAGAYDMNRVIFPMHGDAFNQIPYAQSLPQGKRMNRPPLRPFIVKENGIADSKQSTDSNGLD